jgi:ComF family protein
MDAFRVDRWLAWLGRAILVPRCLLCREPGLRGRDLCTSCAGSLPSNRSACLRCAQPLPEPSVCCGQCLQHPPPLTEVHAAFVYGFPLDRLLPRFKFHGDLPAGRLLSQLMAEALAPMPRPEALVPVPLHRARLRTRGYDQALELARPLARSLRVPLLDEVLARVSNTRPQSELDAVARQRNLRHAFSVTPGLALPAHVALVDDVMTTGATLHAAARVLQRAGVARVDAWVCARAP